MPIHPDTTARYESATREQLLAVVAAADRLWNCQAEFDGVIGAEGACAEYMDELDIAIAKCPGTRAWHWTEESKRSLPSL